MRDRNLLLRFLGHVQPLRDLPLGIGDHGPRQCRHGFGPETGLDGKKNRTRFRAGERVVAR